MPALVKTKHTAKIVWMGLITSRPDVTVDTDAVGALKFDWDGPDGAAHSGRTRPSDSRVLQQHTRGTKIANVRQISIISQEEIDLIKTDMGLDQFDPAWLGANIVVEGLADFSHIPPSSRLQGANGTTLIVDMQNFPCHQISMTIEQNRPNQGKSFKEHAKGRRGVTAWVERPGLLTIGDQLTLHVPVQRAWSP